VAFQEPQRYSSRGLQTSMQYLYNDSDKFKVISNQAYHSGSKNSILAQQMTIKVADLSISFARSVFLLKSKRALVST